jgi:hypothetical protein
MSDEFEIVRQQQVAAKKPAIYCVISAKYEDVTLVCNVIACFFNEDEAVKAKAYMEKDFPIDKGTGWYEIEKTRLSVMG